MELEIDAVQEKIDSGDSFVLNIIATWCPDCTEKQAPNLAAFAEILSANGLPLVNLTVQRDKRVFLSEQHESLVDSVGGHGYPRTVLYVDGKAVDSDNVEVTGKDELSALANKFIGLCGG